MRGSVLAKCVAALILATSASARPSPLYTPPIAPNSSNPALPVCVPPEIPGQPYPKSAVTTVQTGTDCTKYGDPPARVVNDVESPDGLLALFEACHGQIVNMTDNLGEKRSACFYANPKSTTAKPLPLFVWLHPSAFTSTITFPITGLDLVRDTQSLNSADPSRLGFSYILPFGRNTVHQYPVPDNVALGWDNWYRNFDRKSSALNADVDFIDKAIAYSKSHVPVDKQRVYLSGWSNGASMAMIYALNTNGITAASVYSAPDPYRDSQDPCTQAPNPPYNTPIQNIHNYCDIIGTCTTGQYFYQDLKKRYPSLPQHLTVIDTITAEVKGRDGSATCDPACQGVCAVTAGSAAHGRWPTTRNTDTLFAFLRGYTLPASLSWGAPKAA